MATTNPSDSKPFPGFHFGDYLRKARMAVEPRANHFADMLGIDRASVAAYEAGKTMPRRPVLEAWARATGYTVEQILGPDAPPPGGQVVDLRARREQAATTST